MPGHRRSQRSSTLIELLGVIAVISIVMTIMIPALHTVRFRASDDGCSLLSTIFFKGAL